MTHHLRTQAYRLQTVSLLITIEFNFIQYISTFFENLSLDPPPSYGYQPGYPQSTPAYPQSTPGYPQSTPGYPSPAYSSQGGGFPPSMYPAQPYGNPAPNCKFFFTEMHFFELFLIRDIFKRSFMFSCDWKLSIAIHVMYGRQT